MTTAYRIILACTLAAASSSWAQAQGASNTTQGVSKNEIILGSIQDLSGPVAAASKHARQGMIMRADELSEQGGVHGRKIKLFVEDHAFDPKRAVLATQKLVHQEKIFAMVGHFGSSHNIAAMPILFEKNIINFYPIAAARDLHEPATRLKTQFLPNIYDQMRIAAPKVMKDRNLKKPCILYQDDEFGLENTRGAEDGLKAVGVQLAEKTSYKRGATDFSSQIARMKGASCDLVLLASLVRETVGAISESRKIGFNPVFVGTVGSYNDAVPRLGGKDVEGLYATMTAQIPYSDGADAALRTWATKYRTRFNEEPTDYAVYGYHVMDAFIRVAEKAGPNLTVDSFTNALNNTVIPRDMFGNAEETFSPTKRLGNIYPRLSQLQNGKWTVVSDYAAFNGLPDGKAAKK